MYRSLTYLIVVLMMSFSAQLCAQGFFKETPEIKKAYNLIIDLRLDEAKNDIALIKAQDPTNLMVLHLENYLDFFTIFIAEERDQFDLLKKNKKKRLNIIKQQGDKTSPYYLFIQAEIELHWALSRAKFNDVFAAAGEIYSAYKLLSANQKQHPDFIANKKSLSAIHVLSESLPGIVRTLFRIDGTIAQGTSEIEEVIAYSSRNDFMYEEEAIAIYAYILFYQNNQKQKAWDFLKNSELDPSTSPLCCFLIASMAQKMGENDYAITVLEKRPKSPDYQAFHYLDFLLGKSKLYRLEAGANQDLINFLKNFKGQHYIKEAYQKLGWYEWVINDNQTAYRNNLQLVQQKGEDLIDGDKQAQKESKSGNLPDQILLKARLLYDGGYYQRSYDLLKANTNVALKSEIVFLEYHYRLGRIAQKLELIPDAIKYFNLAISRGADSDQYFACNAALQTGLIYERLQNPKLAKHFFELCLGMSPTDYKNSLHQKAKSGLNRLKG